MLKDDNIMNVYYKFYICQLKVSTPYSEFLPKIKAELNQLGEEVFNITDSASKSKIQNDSTTPQNDIGRNLNYLAQTINQYENIDFERNADDNYMKHIIVYEQKFYSRVNILGIIYEFDIISKNVGNKRYILKVDDGTGRIVATFWEQSKFGKKNGKIEMEKMVKPGVKINIFGKITFFNGDIQITGEKFIIVNNYYVENLFNEILIQEQQVLANIQKNNKGQINYSDTTNLLKKIKEKYYTPYNIKLEKNNYINDDNDNNIYENNYNEKMNNCHTKLILKLKHNTNNEENSNNKMNVNPTFEYNVRKFANYLLLVLDEKDLIETNNLKYIVDENEIMKDETNIINNNNIINGEQNDIQMNENNNNNQNNENDKESPMDIEKNNENENENKIIEEKDNNGNENNDKEIEDILEKENVLDNENERKDEDDNKDIDIGIDLDEFINLLNDEEKPFNFDDENIPRGINPTPRKDAKYLRVKLKYLLNDLRIYGLLKHYIPSIDENDPKTIIPVFKIVMNKFEQNMIGKNISKESDENYLESEVEFDVRFIDKLKEQIKNIIKKKNGEKIDFYDIKHNISGKYNQLLLDKIIKLLLQSLVNTGEIYMEDKYAYKYLLY